MDIFINNLVLKDKQVCYLLQVWEKVERLRLWSLWGCIRKTI